MDFVFVQDFKGNVENLKWEVRHFKDFKASLRYLIQCEKWISEYHLVDHFVIWDVDNEHKNVVSLSFSEPKIGTLFNLLYTEEKKETE